MPTMRAWWLLSVLLIALILEVVILAGTMPPALRTVSAASVALWAAALVYFIVGRR